MLYAESGITTAHEGATHLPQLQSIKRASDAGANIIDVIAFPFITDLDRVLAEFPVNIWNQYENRFKIGGVKITIDGSPQGRTAYFTSPYLTGGPGGEKDWRGELTFPQDLVNQMVKRVYDLNLPLNLHCNGDAAIDSFLEAYEFARAGDYTRPWNVTTIHSQFLRKDQIQKFLNYKIRPSLYTLHTFYFADAHIANRGIEQAQYISPMRDVIDAGIHPTNHTDFVVAPLDQMTMLWSAVNRISRSSAVIGPDQRVSPYEGLKCMTHWAAEQYGEHDSKGTLEVGKVADFVILDRDPIKVDPQEIKNIKVVETIKSGKSIFPKLEQTDSPVASAKYAGMSYRWRAHVCDMAEVNQAAGKDWTLTSLLGKPIASQNPPTMKFEKGKVSIFGGVNRLSASYGLTDNQSVTLGQIVSTKIGGAPELMELEQTFSQTLARVDGFHVAGNQLELLSGGEVVAIFKSKDE
jgi:heat shock protein HslJ